MQNTKGQISTVTEDLSVSIPPSVSDAADLRAGDHLRWSIDDGSLQVEVLAQVSGAFADLKPVELDDETNAVVDHDTSRE